MPTYITPEGAQRLQDELIRLRTVTRLKVVQEVADAAAQGDRSENAEYIYGKKKLREIDRRMRFLIQRLDDIAIVTETPDSGKAFFGARVTVEDEDGLERTYRLVGPDEIDAAKGDISYRSPLGAQLLGKALGSSFVLKRPAGDIEYTVMRIVYGAPRT